MITIKFDIDSSNARDRELKLQILLSKDADNYNNKEVALKLEEQHGSTTHFKEYKTIKYILKLRQTLDFDI